MSIIAEEFSITWPNIIMPLILLVGFAISVAIGVWFAWTKWREHQALTICRKCGGDLGTTLDRCPRCGAAQSDEIAAPPP
ncbi:MAG TPA: hypothetical protein VFC46_05345 [Humisphaera sp.]|nr:hypothetical protein [Humisphaera sp.]